MQHQQIIDQEQLAALTGYERAGDIERVLRAQGVIPFYGRRGRLWITVSQLEAARGIAQVPANEEAPF